MIKNLKLKRPEADIVDSIDIRNSNKFDQNKVKLKSHQHFKIKHDTGEVRQEVNLSGDTKLKIFKFKQTHKSSNEDVSKKAASRYNSLEDNSEI